MPNPKTDDIITGVDINLPDIRAQADAKGGFSVWPNLTLGIRIGYQF